MARKIYFDPRSRSIGVLLKQKGFVKGVVLESDYLTYVRSTLEVRQGNCKVFLINHARKQQLVFSSMFDGADLNYFIKTGNFPTHLFKAVEPCDYVKK